MAMEHLNLRCPLYLTSNSGQLLSSEEATALPIQIFSSGATNSIRGASFLSSHNYQLNESRYVVDIGGTTTDIGCLLPSGFPRLASASTEIGKVKVNFAMPQVESLGLGGGSIVHALSDGSISSIGPESVGHTLTQNAVCFGGDSLTASDIMVSAGAVRLGNVTPNLSESMIVTAKDMMKIMLENQIDRMKTSPEPCRVLLVGGGAFLCPSILEGVASIEIPKFAEVANAVGSAVAEIGEAAEAIVEADVRYSSLDQLKAKAISRAILRGAKEDHVRIIEEDISGIAYIEGKYKITVKVAGPVDYERMFNDLVDVELDPSLTADELRPERKNCDSTNIEDEAGYTGIDHAAYCPNVDANRLWHLSETDAYYISIGCYILGCAGGGTPYASYLQTRQLLREGGQIRVIDIEDLPPNALCGPVAAMGSPVVAAERLGGDLILHAMQGLEEYLKIKFTAILAAEIGGANGMSPLLLSSSRHYDIPCVDVDLMGKINFA
jgi:hypothetical protein